MLLLCSRRHIWRRFWLPGEVWVVPPVGLVASGLYWPITLACSATKSLTEGTMGHCSP